VQLAILMTHDAPDAVVGAGPNGLAAAITLARAGRRVVVWEAAPVAGGGVRSAELTLPGFVHDVCSAVHPLAVASPFLRGLPLGVHGLTWVHPAAPLAHPLDDGTAAVLERSVAETAGTLGPDGRAWIRLFEPLVRRAETLFGDVLGPFGVPRHPIVAARLGLHAIRSADGLARGAFRGERARALFAGIAAHSAAPLTGLASAAIGVVLALAGHAVGWPFPRGGAARLADALCAHLAALGGEVRCGAPVSDLSALGPVSSVLLDLTPRQVVRVAAGSLPDGYRRALARWRYGPGVFKVDWALREPIPWRAAACRRAGIVHLGGTLAEIASAEAEAWRGTAPRRPFVLLAQPTLFDPTRAPAGRHVAWAYCHVPNGSSVDMTARIEDQVERFAPGFREIVLARSVRSPAVVEASNPNLVGGDISGGAVDFRQLLFRPVPSLSPYRTPIRGVYLCSSSTWPGPGVHGMCGHLAARLSLSDRGLTGDGH
jgi:phytoene dehydrogenase-like protein